jgi:hypothetical protein
MLSSIFGDITPCSLLKVNRHFRGTFHLHLQGWRLCQARNQHEAGSKQHCLLHAGFYKHVGTHTSIILKSTIFWDITPCSPMRVNRRFGEHIAWRWRWYVPPKSWSTLNRLHGIISQKMVLFVTTGMRTSNPTSIILSLFHIHSAYIFQI